MDKHTVITIGRQFGSGGKQVALEIGRILGIRVLDKELIVEAARESGLGKGLFEKMDERKNLYSINAGFGGNELFQIQSNVISRIAEEGDAIFVGRCSNYVLRETPSLDVFLTAPSEVRAARVMERCSVSEKEALSMMQKQDKARAAYYNFFSFGDWGAASDYDLCLDSSMLGIEGTAEYIIEFGRKAGIIR
ncbi:MAG: cytidylate kinase-like family protein [Bacteroidales bacterium]|nr:cytidylate kinase-like family protein [Bacteroidales bacterium]